jgi:hypothetical protein
MRARVESHLEHRRSLVARDGLTWLRRTGAARTLLAGVLLVVATVAPFAASWHEASVQHVRCAEHGELTHVAVSHMAPDGGDRRPSVEAGPSMNRGETGTPAGHEHCDLTFVVQGSAQTPPVRTTVRIVPPSVLATAPVVAVPAPGRAFVLASAPKTSPPVV